MPADASSYSYQLKKIVKKEKIVRVNGLNGKSIWAFISQHKWQLIQMNGKQVTGKNPYLVFVKDKPDFNGFAGCNRIFGVVQKTEKEISFNHVASTAMACEEMKIEAEFVQTLNNKKFSFDVADQTLNFYYNNKLVLMFAKAALKEE